MNNLLESLIDDFRKMYDAKFWELKESTYESWWEGTLGRPLIHIARHPHDLEYKPGVQKYQRFWPYYREGLSIDSMLIAMINDMNHMRCYGDGFPHRFPQFGAGVLAQMLGAESKNISGTVWFEPPDEISLGSRDLNLIRSEGSSYALIYEIYERMAEVFPSGLVQIGMTDIGGSADILNSFSPAGVLLMDLYDKPEMVKDQLKRVHSAWREVFFSYAKILNRFSPGYTCWTPMLSKKSYYMLQCDLAYMIGPVMFEEFILEELKESSELLERPFYHLDGKGQLAHLDMILSIERLKGIQWIPGEGSPPLSEWPEVFRKISDAGKKIQLFWNPDDDPFLLDKIADQIGRADNICVVWADTYRNQSSVDELLGRFL